MQPCVALGAGLKAAGHSVTVCASAAFESFITDYGLDYGYMNDEFIQLIGSDAGREAMDNTDSFLGVVKTTIKLFKRVKPILRRTLEDAWRAAQKVNPDIVIFASKGGFAEPIADKLNVPMLMAMPFPQLVPTGETPSMGFPDLKLGAWYNQLTYKIVHWAAGLYNGVPNRFRREVLKIPKKSRSSWMLTRADGSPIPHLHCFSEQVVPRPVDWPDHAYVNGVLVFGSAEDMGALGRAGIFSQ